MKRFKFPLFLLAMGIAIAGAFAANVKPAESNKPFTIYYYVGDNTLAEMQDPEKWLNSGSGCEAGDDYPCTINFTGGDRAAFDAHVENFSSIAQVNLEAATKRN